MHAKTEPRTLHILYPGEGNWRSSIMLLVNRSTILLTRLQLWYTTHLCKAQRWMSLAEKCHKSPPNSPLPAVSVRPRSQPRAGSRAPTCSCPPPALFSITSFKAWEQHFETWCSRAPLEQLLIGKQVRLHLPNSRSSAAFHHWIPSLAEY